MPPVNRRAAFLTFWRGRLDEARIAVIPLYRRDGSIRAYATIDSDTAQWAEQWRWRVLEHSERYRYAVRYERVSGKKIVILMHREIMGLPRKDDGREVDHFNHDGLDNQRSNLRVVTTQQNLQNKRSYCGATSGFRGVYWHKLHKKWCAEGRMFGVKQHLGYFDNEEKAAEAASRWRKENMPYSLDAGCLSMAG